MNLSSSFFPSPGLLSLDNCFREMMMRMNMMIMAYVCTCLLCTRPCSSLLICIDSWKPRHHSSSQHTSISIFNERSQCTERPSVLPNASQQESGKAWIRTKPEQSGPGTLLSVSTKDCHERPILSSLSRQHSWLAPLILFICYQCTNNKPDLQPSMKGAHSVCRRAGME